MKALDWGNIPYKQALEQQLSLVEQVVSKEAEDTLVFCSHPPVVTLGRATQEGDLFGWQGEVVEASRGGRATFHGPNQVIVYPIIALEKQRENLKAKDLHAYLRALEKAIVMALKEFGLDSKVEDTGVWVQNKKVASIGIAVKKWVTYHGLALNVFKDENAFQGIRPCGYSADKMTSLEEVLPEKVDLEKIKSTLENCLRLQFT